MKLINKVISERLSMVENLDTDVDLVYEALEKLYEIISYENSGKTSSMVTIQLPCGYHMGFTVYYMGVVW